MHAASQQAITLIILLKQHDNKENSPLPTFFKVLGFFDFVISRSRTFFA